MPSGRVRQFDFDEALNRAMEVFWKQGYEGTSIDDLTEAMGINRPSLYAAFGNKEQLFHKALEKYQTGPVAFTIVALKQPTARKAVEALLCGAVRMLTDKNKPHGCLVVQGALACSEGADTVRRALAECREGAVTALRERFERGVKEGDLPAGTDCMGLARYVATVMNGLSVQASGGARAEELQRTAEWALRAWPG